MQAVHKCMIGPAPVHPQSWTRHALACCHHIMLPFTSVTQLCIECASVVQSIATCTHILTREREAAIMLRACCNACCLRHSLWTLSRAADPAGACSCVQLAQCRLSVVFNFARHLKLLHCQLHSLPCHASHGPGLDARHTPIQHLLARAHQGQA